MPAPDPNRLITRAVATFLAGLVLLYTLYLIKNVLLVLYIGSLLAIGFSPAVRWLERRRFRKGRARLPRWAAILLLYVSALLGVLVVVALILPPLLRQLEQLWANLPGHVDRLQQTLVSTGLIDHTWTWSDVVKSIEIPSVALTSVLGALKTALGVVSAIATVLLLPFYLLLESASLRRAALLFVAEDRRSGAGRVMQGVTEKVGAWLGGQLLLAIVIGATASIGLWIIGVPYFYVLGLVAAVGEAIPVVGPILAAVPAIFMGWTVSPQTALVVLAYFAVQQFVENNFLVPRIMERQVGISPVTILVALLIGTELLGIVGAVLAVPTAAIAQVLVQEYLARHDE
jgi:predicted PurR-regulated permease PerM